MKGRRGGLGIGLNKGQFTSGFQEAHAVFEDFEKL
jgi:hypothetical protein